MPRDDKIDARTDARDDKVDARVRMHAMISIADAGRIQCTTLSWMPGKSSRDDIEDARQTARDNQEDARQTARDDRTDATLNATLSGLDAILNSQDAFADVEIGVGDDRADAFLRSEDRTIDATLSSTDRTADAEGARNRALEVLGILPGSVPPSERADFASSEMMVSEAGQMQLESALGMDAAAASGNRLRSDADSLCKSSDGCG